MRYLVAVFVIPFLIALTLFVGSVTIFPVQANECNVWAQQLGQSDKPDSVVMHAIGCDDGRKADTNYQRSEGRCAAAARHAYRQGMMPFSLQFNLYVGRDHQCVSYEDWTWDSEY